MNIDALIETMVSDAQLATGADRDVLQAQGGFARSAPYGEGGRPARWTRAEDDFLRRKLAELGVDECARILGRSANAVKVRFTRKAIAAPSKAEGWLTAHQAANLLGIDGHKTAGWMDRGIMPGAVAGWSERRIRMVSIVRLKMWLIRPETWIYIDADRIQHPSLRRLVRLAQERWGDEWWTTNMAAEFHGCDNTDILRYIEQGKLPALQAPYLGGRNQARWSHWFVRKSDALSLVVYRGRGSGRELGAWSPRADGFILLSREQGLMYKTIARMMKWPQKRVEYRAHQLRRK